MGFWQKFLSPPAYIGAVILLFLGLAPANITEWLSLRLSSEVASWISGDNGRWTFVLGAVLIFAVTERRRRRLIQINPEQRAPALSLPSMPITDIAEYLCEKSAWGWRKRKELNLRRLVRDAVPDELRRVGRNGEVRFIGSAPIDPTSLEINPGYWDEATFDGDEIWDRRNEVFTIVSHGRVSAMYMRFGRAPNDDVIRAWPPASRTLRLWIRSLLWLRRVRHGFSVAWHGE